MEWIKIVAPLIGVILGWGLSERAKIWADKRLDKRKIRRLLFYVLELRFHFTRELNAQKTIDNYIQTARIKLKEQFGEESELGIDMYLPFVKQIIEKQFGVDNKIEFLEQNIDSVIFDLSEVFPVFAYELSGQHNIKERLRMAESHLSDFDNLIEQLPFDLKDWLKPKLTEDLLDDLDKNLKKISQKIGNKVWSEVQEKIKRMDSVDSSDLTNLLDEYIAKVKKSG